MTTMNHHRIHWRGLPVHLLAAVKGETVVTVVFESGRVRAVPLGELRGAGVERELAGAMARTRQSEEREL